MIARTPEYRPLNAVESSLDSMARAIRPVAVALGLTLMITMLWLLTHRYQGFASDAKIYAFQALARIHTTLAGDLYLQNTSQDQFTIFSPFYAVFIGWFGLRDAALMLTVSFNVWILAASWKLARNLDNRDIAWLSVAFLVITVGEYGAAGVFHFSEQYLTARLPAEALIVTAFACYFQNLRTLSLCIAAGAMLVHPLIALPGLLALICMGLPYRTTAAAMLVGLLAALGIAVVASTVPAVSRSTAVIDPIWLEVAHERSQFLFLQFWSAHDWQVNARPFVCLILAAQTIPDERIRKFCTVAITVGAAGMVVALIASFMGSVAILVQGQAWRWVWIVAFGGVLLVPSTVAHVWRDKRCGLLCAILLVLGWVFAAIDGTVCILAAFALWSVRAHITERVARYLHWAALLLALVMIVWTMANSWTLVSSPPSESGRESLVLVLIRNVLGLGIPAAILAWLTWWWIRSARSLWVPLTITGTLLAGSAFSLPGAFKQIHPIELESKINEFEDWRQVIPPTSSVLVAPAKDTGAFVWFTLGRPNYLSVDQSAGVIFSRKTAMEVRRRSQVLLPLMDANWRILTINRRGRVKNIKANSESRPLTKITLLQICGDEQLGFVVAPENVGFDPIRHTHAGAWKDWNLYDCRRVRNGEPST